MSSDNTEQLQAYCIMCRTGSEKEVKLKIERFTEGIEAIVPKRVIEEKKGGAWSMVERPLLPGYVFLYAQDTLPHDLKWKIHKIYKILNYARDMRQLQDEDREYAHWLYRHEGCIRPSTILEEGDRIRVIAGPLLDATGKITRLDKRHRRAWVTFEFDGHERTVSLSANCVEQASPSGS